MLVSDLSSLIAKKMNIQKLVQNTLNYTRLLFILYMPIFTKSQTSISIAFSIDILIRNENITSEEHKTKYRLK